MSSPHPILRVPEGMQLSVHILAQVEAILPNFRQESYAQKPRDTHSICRRIKSLHDAFIFLLQAHPISPHTPIDRDTFIAYAHQALEESSLNEESFEELYKKLEFFEAKLISVINFAWNWSTQESIAALNLAEQYLIMTKGRARVATITALPFTKKNEFVLQVNNPIPPYSQEWIDELTLLKN